MAKYERTNCPICNKAHLVKKWKRRTGILKGETMVSDVFGSKECRKIFTLKIQLNDLDEMKREIQEKIKKLTQKRTSEAK